MKRSISLIISLALLFSIIAPIGVSAESAPAEDSELTKLYAKIYNSEYAEKFREMDFISVEQIFEFKNYLKGEGYVSRFINEVYNLIGENEELKKFLWDKYNINRDNVNELKEIVYTWEGENEEDLKTILKSLKSDNKKVPTEWYSVIGELKREILNAFPEEKEDLKAALIDPTFENVLSLSIDLRDALLENLIVKEINEKPDLKFEVDKEGLYAAIDEIEKEYINEWYRLPEDVVLDDTIDDFVGKMEDYYEEAKTNLEGKVDDTINVDKLFAKIIENLVENYIPYEEDDDSGYTPIYSSPITTEPFEPEITVPEDKDAPATVTLGKDSVVVRTEEGALNVEVNSSDAVKAIKALRKEVGEDRQAQLNVDLSSFDYANMNIVLSDDIIEAAKDNEVSLNIVFNDMDILIPYDALNKVEIDKGATVVLNVGEVTESVKDKVAEYQQVKKAISLNLEVVKGSKIEQVRSFNTPVVVKIDVKGLWNENRIAVYYLNEETDELEFVTGKIVNDEFVLELDHFSKYLVVQSYKTFTDITNHWARVYIESMAAKNVVDGYDDGTFRPNTNVTRAEFAKMILEGLEVELVKYDGQFTDVKSSDWYADYLATMKELGLAEGYDDGTFRPNQYITRAEVAVILSNIIDVEVEEDEVDDILAQFTDKDEIADWARIAIAKVVKAKVMVGDNNKFSPSDNTTRAESATTIFRIYNK